MFLLSIELLNYVIKLHVPKKKSTARKEKFKPITQNCWLLMSHVAAVVSFSQK